MASQVNQAYQIVDNPYYQALSDNPAAELVIENSEVTTSRRTGNHEQQKLASQMPRGTRMDETGTRLQIRGGRNYTSRKLFVSRDEMFDDIVMRGLRADGLSTKLGVKNHKESISKLLSDLFHDDHRSPIVQEHFKTGRQKSNCAKTMFATMTQEELQFIKAETFPSRIDVQVRDCLMNTFADHPEKLQSTVEVLGQVQQLFKVLTPHTDFLSSHNFQTRGFFLDIVLMTCSFIMQIIQDSDSISSAFQKPLTKDKPTMQDTLSSPAHEKMGKENKTAAEILLSVGSDILDKTQAQDSNLKLLKKQHVATTLNVQETNSLTAMASNTANINHNLPTTIVVEGTPKPDGVGGDHWTTVEMVDGEGNSKYMLIKTDPSSEGSESFDAVKILEMLQSQGVNLDEEMEVALSNPNSTVKTVKKFSSENPADDDLQQSDKVTLEIKTMEESDDGGRSTMKKLIRGRTRNMESADIIVQVEEIENESMTPLEDENTVHMMTMGTGSEEPERKKRKVADDNTESSIDFDHLEQLQARVKKE